MRVVRGPDGQVSIDTTGRAAGRGAYLCADGSCWRTALERKAIERALGVSLPPEVRSRLEAGPLVADPTSQGGARGT